MYPDEDPRPGWIALRGTITPRGMGGVELLQVSGGGHAQPRFPAFLAARPTDQSVAVWGTSSGPLLFPDFQFVGFFEGIPDSEEGLHDIATAQSPWEHVTSVFRLLFITREGL